MKKNVYSFTNPGLKYQTTVGNLISSDLSNLSVSSWYKETLKMSDSFEIDQNVDYELFIHGSK